MAIFICSGSVKFLREVCQGGRYHVCCLLEQMGVEGHSEVSFRDSLIHWTLFSLTGASKKKTGVWQLLIHSANHVNILEITVRPSISYSSKGIQCVIFKFTFDKRPVIFHVNFGLPLQASSWFWSFHFSCTFMFLYWRSVETYWFCAEVLKKRSVFVLTWRIFCADGLRRRVLMLMVWEGYQTSCSYADGFMSHRVLILTLTAASHVVFSCWSSEETRVPILTRGTSDVVFSRWWCEKTSCSYADGFRRRRVLVPTLKGDVVFLVDTLGLICLLLPRISATFRQSYYTEEYPGQAPTTWRRWTWVMTVISLMHNTIFLWCESLNTMNIFVFFSWAEVFTLGFYLLT